MTSDEDSIQPFTINGYTLYYREDTNTIHSASGHEMYKGSVNSTISWISTISLMKACSLYWIVLGLKVALSLVLKTWFQWPNKRNRGEAVMIILIYA